MVSQSTRNELLRLSAADRIRVAQDLWDSIVDNAADAPLSDVERELLDQRLAAYRDNPDQGDDWDTFRDRVRKRGDA